MKHAISIVTLCAILLDSRLTAADPLPPLTVTEAGAAAMLGAAFAGAIALGCGLDVKVTGPIKTRCELAAGVAGGALLALAIPLLIVGRQQTSVSSTSRLMLTATAGGGTVGWTGRF